MASQEKAKKESKKNGKDEFGFPEQELVVICSFI
jgi:hypothetical protein